jgi:hypothetical protein
LEEKSDKSARKSEDKSEISISDKKSMKDSSKIGGKRESAFKGLHKIAPPSRKETSSVTKQEGS